MNEHPNILLIVMDSVRTRNLSCNGYNRATTPNLDRLATQGMLFEQAISMGSWTLPVHTSLFTGLYSLNHGVTLASDALPDNFPTLARRLREAGYQTACFSNNPFISKASGLTQGFDTVEDLWQMTRPGRVGQPRMSARLKQLRQRSPLMKPIVRLAHMLLRARLITKRVMEREKDSGARLTNQKIQQWLAETWRRDAPFFIFINYMECHEPYISPYPYNRRFMPARFSPWRVAARRTDKAEILSGSEKRRADDLEIIRALYDGALSYLDDKIAELLRLIEAQGILNDTMTVITADHGDSLGEHNHLGHRMTLYDQLVHVPLLIRYPARFQPGKRISHQVPLGNLHPTLLELAGADPAQAATNGFRSLLQPSISASHPFIVAENTGPKSVDHVTMRMIRTDQYKYIWKSNQQHELYDLARDPAEASNLIAVQPEVAWRMGEQLAAWEREHESQRIETGEAEYDETTLKRLRGLGYIG
jgi:arylsulfatase A-like enzyme